MSTRAVILSALIALGAMNARVASAVCVLTCPDDIRENASSFEQVPQVSYTVTGSSDCSGILQTSGLPSGSFFPIGTTTNCFKDTESAANCCFDVRVVEVGFPGAPALGPLGLSALAALLAGLGVWAARRRRTTA
jgi:hypothetical protein